MKVGDLVELLDQSAMSNSKGEYDYYPSGILGLVMGEDITRMLIVKWFSMEYETVWPKFRLRVVNKAKDG
jgi:hypothetical protein